MRDQQDRAKSTDLNAPLMAGSIDVEAHGPNTRGRRKRFRIGHGPWLAVAALVFLSLVMVSVPGARRSILRAIGRQLVVEQAAVKSADIIVLAVDADGQGTLEVADLVHRGVSNRVAVFDDYPSKVDLEFLRRGVPHEDSAAVAARQLHSLGVQNVEKIPRSTSGSEQEGEILPGWCDAQNYHSVVLVTSSDHSRRLGRILRRSVRGRSLEITVEASPYSEFDPNTWWETRGGTREGIVELEKLLLDFARHPFS